MRFDVAGDDGLAVAGWVTPDNPAAPPAVIAVLDDGRRFRIPATVVWPDLRRLGLHATGLCGFVVDATSCPGLGAWGGLMLLDQYTNTLIYRRPTELVSSSRLFHLETDPNPVLPGLVGSRFQAGYGAAEFIGEETLACILGIVFTPSVFVSGALSYRRFEHQIRTAGFARSILLDEPLRRLAATLLRLKARGAAGTRWSRLGQDRLVVRFADVDLTNSRAVSAVLESLDLDDLRHLADPVTRLLAATDPQQTLSGGDVAQALERLASFEVIGFTDARDEFATAIDRMLTDGRSLGVWPDEPLDIEPVSACLALCGAAEDLIGLDRELIDTARTVIANSAPD